MVSMQVVVMDKLDYCATLNNLREIADLPNFRFVKGSIQSLDLVSHVLESENVDTVMHFAAQVRRAVLLLSAWLWLLLCCLNSHICCLLPYTLSRAVTCALALPDAMLIALRLRIQLCMATVSIASGDHKHSLRLAPGEWHSTCLLTPTAHQAWAPIQCSCTEVQTHVDNSFGNSLEFTMNNTYGTHVLLEASRKWGNIRRFINVSTDEVYGETSLGKDQGCDETTTLEPTNPYSAAKAGAEMMVRSYMTSYKLPCIITRGNNVYGPHQFPEKLIPKMTLLAHRGQDLPVHGNGRAVRAVRFRLCHASHGYCAACVGDALCDGTSANSSQFFCSTICLLL